MKSLQRTKDGIAYEDGVLELPDGREMAWRWWGEPGGKSLLRIQGTPSSRLQRNPDESALRDSGARYLMADRPGYGSSTRKRGRGIADVADDYAELLKAHGLQGVPAMGTSGGGPHVLALGHVVARRRRHERAALGRAPGGRAAAQGRPQNLARGRPLRLPDP